MADDDDETPRRTVRVDGTITLGNIVQILMLCGGVGVWLIASSNRSEQAGKDIVVLQNQLTSQIFDLRGTVTGGLKDLQTQIAGLPDQKAALDQSLRRINDVEQRYNAIDARLNQVAQTAIETRADLNTVLRQVNSVRLPGGR